MRQRCADWLMMDKSRYSGYVTDPDGHHWEFAFNPHWVLKDGRVALGE